MIIKIIIINPIINPILTPNTKDCQKLKKIIIPKHNPVKGPANFEQNLTTSMDEFAPIED